MPHNPKIRIIYAFGLILFSMAFAFAQEPRRMVTGQVIDQNGEGVGGASVCAHPALHEPSINCAVSGPDGTYRLIPRKDGRFFMIAEKREQDHYSQWRGYFRHPDSPPSEIEIGPSSPTANVNVKLPPPNGILAGRSVDAATGLPVDAVSFELCHAGRKACSTFSARNDQGTFRLPAAHVSMTVKATAYGYEDWHGPNGEKSIPFEVASGVTREFTINLKRKPWAVGKAMHETEKSAATHLPAPEMLSPADQARIEIFPRDTRIEWSAVEGAVQYGVEVEFCYGRDRQTCSDPQPLRAATINAREGGPVYFYDFKFVGAQPGRWRVWGVDKNSEAGFKSPWRTIFYLR